MSLTTETVGFYLDDRFALLPVSGMTIVMQLANDVAGQELYRWFTISRQRGPVQSGTGLQMIADCAFEEVQTLDRLVISSETDSRFDETDVLNWLRKLERHGVVVGSVATATWILAKAGLLHKRKCTINPTHWTSFREVYPGLSLTRDLFNVEGRIFSCAGGTAAIDMALSFVALVHGMDLAMEVASFILHGKIRPNVNMETIGVVDLGVLHPDVHRAISVMERTIETPLSIESLAHEIEVSPRQLSRLFRDKLGESPASRYRSIRLRRAHWLLCQTDLPISDIAVTCGFSSLSKFSTTYRQRYLCAPREARARAKGSAPIRLK